MYMLSIRIHLISLYFCGLNREAKEDFSFFNFLILFNKQRIDEFKDKKAKYVKMCVLQLVEIFC